MTEETTGAAEGNTQQQPPRVQMLGQYIKDLSFENVAIQKNTKIEEKTEMQVRVSVDVRTLNETRYEVTNKLKLNAKAGEADVFVMELDYSGVFQLENIPKEQLALFLMVECPRLLFPYLRRVVGDVSRDGGFPPVNLEQIDYLSIYRQQLQRVAEQQKQQNQPAN